MTRAAIKSAEERLREALLESDVAALDLLFDDALIYTGPDGSVGDKEGALELVRSGAQKVSRYEPSELRVQLHGDMVGVVSVRVELAGESRGRPFAGAYRFSRTYVREAGAWRIACVQASAIA